VFKTVKAIVTGGCGFIGSWLVERLVSEGWTVKILDNLQRGKRSHVADLLSSCDLIVVDLKSHSMAMDHVRDVDVVFHLASHLGGINYIHQSQAAVSDNLAINWNVFDACLQNEVPKVVFLSSACAYPTWMQSRQHHPPLKENMALSHGAYPESMYGWAKLMGELQLQAMVREHDIKAAILRPFNAYGPREHFDVEKGHVIPAMMVKALRRDDPFRIWGSGTQERSFMYVADLVDAIMLAYERSDDAQPINVGDPQRVTMLDLAVKITDLAGYRPKFVLRPDRPEGVFSRGPDVTRAKEILGWTFKVSLEEGLKRTWEWARLNVSV